MQKRILIADDDTAIRTLLARVLEMEQYQTVPAESGREAVYQCVVRHPDLVLLDLSMPNRDGWEAYELIRTFDSLLPVIVITALPDQYERAARAGINGLMEKPLDLPLLLETIQDLLRKSEEERIARLVGEFYDRPSPASRVRCELLQAQTGQPEPAGSTAPDQDGQDPTPPL